MLGVKTGLEGLHDVHLSADSEHVAQSGWHAVHGAELLAWKKPVGQLEADMHTPLTARWPPGQVRQKSGEPSHVVHDEEHAEKAKINKLSLAKRAIRLTLTSSGPLATDGQATSWTLLHTFAIVQDETF